MHKLGEGVWDTSGPSFVFGVYHLLKCRESFDFVSFLSPNLSWTEKGLVENSGRACQGGATDQMILLRLARAVKSMRAIRMVQPGVQWYPLALLVLWTRTKKATLKVIHIHKRVTVGA